MPDPLTLSHTRLLQEELLARIEARLAQAPNTVELQIERAHLLAELKRPKEAAEVYREAVKSGPPKYPLTSRAYSILPYAGQTLPITVLMLVPPAWGNAPFRKYLDDQTFLTLQVIADYHEPGLVLPPTQLVVNCISDADLCGSSLEAATALLSNSTVPVINAPAQVTATGREANARRLGSIPGVRTPKTATFSRDVLAGKDVVETLRQNGFSFPLLLRAPGYHTGLHFVRAENPQELAAALPALPGDNFTVLEFLDARDAEGEVRKYRVMVIDGKFYPAHAAVSRDWKVHFFSSSNADFERHRTEDKAFLENMEAVLGPRAMETLGRIHEAVKLDYYGIDFSLGADGEILLFEANATMNVNPPDQQEMWAYRRGPVQRIADAFRVLLFQRAFSSSGGMVVSPSEALREFTLRQMEARLQREPDFVELNIDRARLLIEMERYEEARKIYLDILIKDPTQYAAIVNLAALFNMMAMPKEALKLYQGAAALDSENLLGRVNLAHTLRELGELEEARLHYEDLLRQFPDNVEAHLGLAYVLMYQGEKDAAWEHRRLGDRGPSKPPAPEREDSNLPAILILASPCGGNSPITRFIRPRDFRISYLVPDFYTPSIPLPPHDLVINAIGDADHCGTSLETAAGVLAQTTAPVINLPACVQTTGRADNARLLGTLEGVVTPRIATFSRDVLAGKDGVAALEQQGFTFPLLLRTPGFHGGAHFLRVENADALAPAAASLPGPRQMAIEYLDARDADGKIRKYRVMMIDGKLHPLHKAISSEWMIHYFSAEMADSAAHRAEDATFLEDMPGVLGAKVIAALERIRDALGLDYAGADFSLGRNDEILLFEANATMTAPHPPPGEIWDYRRAPVRRVQDAVRKLIAERAGHPPMDIARA